MSKFEQLNLLGDISVNSLKDNKKRNWENAFQRWSNDKLSNDPTTHFGKCGYGSICDYCDDNSYGRPCVRALNCMCRENHIKIDYDNRNFEIVWDMCVGGNYGTG